MILQNAYENLLIDLELARRQNFYFGAKLVRGAYIMQERSRANEVGYEDPTNRSFEATTEMVALKSVDLKCNSSNRFLLTSLFLFCHLFSNA